MGSRTTSPSVAGYIAATQDTTGLRMSVYRFEEWRQRGLVPRPSWAGQGRARGSAETYPWYTKWQTIAAAEAVREFRNIDAAILALWVDGWPIEVEDLRSAALSWLRPLKKAIDEDVDRLGWQAKERSQYADRGQRWRRRRGSRDRYSQTRYYEALMGGIGAFAGRGMSPGEVEELMLHSGADVALNQVFARAGEEHGPFPLEQIAENAKGFTLEALSSGVATATEGDFEFARAIGRYLMDALVHHTEVEPEFDRVSAALIALSCLPDGPFRPLIDQLFTKLAESATPPS